MRDKRGIMLMEDQNGEIAVQLFADPVSALEAYKNLVGSPVDPSRRATFISLEYGNSAKVQAVAKMLPVIMNPDKQPDGYLLGTGPIHFDKKDS